jgi:hypothetical protein
MLKTSIDVFKINLQQYMRLSAIDYFRSSTARHRKDTIFQTTIRGWSPQHDRAATRGSSPLDHGLAPKPGLFGPLSGPLLR